MKRERSSDKPYRYEKFVVLWKKDESPPNAMPWTGIEPTMNFVREKLEEGCTVQIKPFTREDWTKCGTWGKREV